MATKVASSLGLPIPFLLPSHLPSSAFTTFLISCAILTASYFLIERLIRLPLPPNADKQARKEHRNRERKRRSWILTLVGSAVTTTSSLPFLYDLIVVGGWDVAKVHKRDLFAQSVTSFFVSYLVTDLTVGLFRYGEQVSVLTGYVHHTAYTLLLTHVLRNGYAHIFVLAAIMELPTFVLSLGVLAPKFRSDLIFTGLFFVTRIAFHIALVCLYGSPYGRTYGPRLVDVTGAFVPSWVPLGGLMAAAPLHIMWFTSSVKGTLKRRRVAALARSQVPIIVVPTATSTPTPPSPRLLPARRPKLVSLASSYLLSSRTTLFDDDPTQQQQRRLSRARIAIEREVRSYFSKEEAERDSNDILKVLGGGETVPGLNLKELRLRAGRGGADLKRFGGRLRRRVTGGLAEVAGVMTK